MMKIFLFLAAVIGAALTDESMDYYTTANDNLNMQEVVDDPNKLQELADCFLDKGPCNKVYTSYRKVLGEAVQEGCKKCNKFQKHLGRVFFTAFMNKLPNEYQNFKQKYDPNGEYMQNFLKSLNLPQ